MNYRILTRYLGQGPKEITESQYKLLSKSEQIKYYKDVDDYHPTSSPSIIDDNDNDDISDIAIGIGIGLAVDDLLSDTGVDISSQSDDFGGMGGGDFGGGGSSGDW